jgi:capping protein alpha
MADDALPPREEVEAMSFENPQDADVDLDAAAENEGAAAAEDFQEPAPLTAEEAEARGVAQHLLTNAPPGEFQAVLDDVAALAPGRALEEGFVAGVARLWNAQLLETAVTPDGARVVLCRAAEVSPTTYRDTTGTLYEVDRAALSAVPGGTDDEDHALTATKHDVQKALSVYTSCHYTSEGHAATYVVGDALRAVVRGSKTQLGNFHSGSWASAWALTPSGDGFAVTGTIHVRAHYFEDGNVQLYATKDVTVRGPRPTPARRRVEVNAVRSTAFMRHSRTSAQAIHARPRRPRPPPPRTWRASWRRPNRNSTPV